MGRSFKLTFSNSRCNVKKKASLCALKLAVRSCETLLPRSIRLSRDGAGGSVSGGRGSRSSPELDPNAPAPVREVTGEAASVVVGIVNPSAGIEREVDASRSKSRSSDSKIVGVSCRGEEGLMGVLSGLRPMERREASEAGRPAA